MQIKDKKYRSLIFLVTILAAMIFIFEIMPRIGNVISTFTTLVEEKSKVEKSTENDLLLSKLKLENRSLKSEVNSLVSRVEGSTNISSLITLLDSIAGKSNVSILEIKPRKQVKEGNLLMQNVEASFHSDFEAFYNYTRFLEHSPKVIRLRELYIKAGEPLNDSLNIKAKFDFYLNL